MYVLKPRMASDGLHMEMEHRSQNRQHVDSICFLVGHISTLRVIFTARTMANGAAGQNDVLSISYIFPAVTKTLPHMTLKLRSGPNGRLRAP